MKKRKARNQKYEENLTTNDEVDVDVNVDVVDPENVVTPEPGVVPEDVVPLDDENAPSCSQGFEMNFIMNLQVLNDMINLVGKCPECNHDNMSVSIDPHNKKGLAQVINLEFPCGWSKTIFSSKRIDETNNKSRFDVNLRTVIAFCEIGKGLSAIERYCSHMNQ